MSNWLKRLIISRVDLVDYGANPDAHIVLFKRNTSTEGGDNVDIDKLLKDLGIDADPATAIRDAVTKHVDGIKALHTTEINKAKSEVEEAVQKAADADEAKKKAEEDKKKAEEDKKKAEEGLTEAKEEIAKRNTIEEGITEEVMKSLPEAVRKRLQAADEAEKVSKRLQDEAETATFVAKAREFTKLPAKPEEFGLVLKSLSKSDKASYEQIVTVLKACNAAIEKGNLFVELGSNTDDEAGTALAQLQAKANEMVTKSKGTTSEQAFTQVCRENPDLYRQYRNERGGAK